MPAVIKSILPNSPLSETIIKPYDILHSINGKTISDILDYKFYSNDSRLMLELTDSDEKIKYVAIRKEEGADLGLEFESNLLDKQHTCENNCIFCFIDQLPGGMRSSLYYKDDDLRLSFLQGNYITLTNLTRNDIRRIIKMRISPINVSIHTLNPKLRCLMLRNKNAGLAINKLYTLAKANIKLNCQIVCCPGVNDGIWLNRTMNDLMMLGPAINSVSVVPVGLTKHRAGLTPLTPFDSELALKTIHQVERISRKCFNVYGKRVFFCSDELYIMAGKRLPSYKFYEDYPQLENGVGMMRLFMTEFIDHMHKIKISENIVFKPFSIVTGILAADYLEKLLKAFNKWYYKNKTCFYIPASIYAIKNEFFGESITVSGLITGRDIITQLKDRDLGYRLLIPQNMLRCDEDVFLDDMTISELSQALNVPITVVKQNGADFFRALIKGD